MTWQAVIMAGGRGERMSLSGDVRPKPLVPAAGVPLLERNFQKLVQHGFRRVFVSVHRSAGAIRTFLAERLQPLGALLGVDVNELVEDDPLGNIGSVQLLPDLSFPTLVVYADNLTALDLRDFCAFHAVENADLTLAVHVERFRMPYGAIRLAADGKSLANYREKPLHEELVCSAVAALGARALRHGWRVGATGLSELCGSMIEDGARVVGYSHSAAWIDINDQAALGRAEALIASDPSAFEIWLPSGVKPVEYVAVVSQDVGGAAVVVAPLAPGSSPRAGAAAVAEGPVREMTLFDHVVSGERLAVRCHVFEAGAIRDVVDEGHSSTGGVRAQLVRRIKAGVRGAPHSQAVGCVELGG